MTSSAAASLLLILLPDVNVFVLRNASDRNLGQKGHSEVTQVESQTYQILIFLLKRLEDIIRLQDDQPVNVSTESSIHNIHRSKVTSCLVLARPPATRRRSRVLGCTDDVTFANGRLSGKLILKGNLRSIWNRRKRRDRVVRLRPYRSSIATPGEGENPELRHKYGSHKRSCIQTLLFFHFQG